ncbi:MAG: hypothetical protein WAP74_00045 [Patescibacteria group bacterium]
MEREPIDGNISSEYETKQKPQPQSYNEVLSTIRKYWASHHGQDSRSGTTVYRQECARMFMEGTLDPTNPEHQKNLATADQVLDMMKNPHTGASLPSTTLTLYKLALFNALRHKHEADIEPLDTVLSTLKKFDHYEEQYLKSDNPYPAIAVELETPVSKLNASLITTLNRLTIPNSPEFYWNQPDPIWEVNLPSSYSPWVQAAAVNELKRMGALPEESESKEVPVHINIEIPNDIVVRDQGCMVNLAFATSIGYLSPQRIARAKWSDRSFTENGAFSIHKSAKPTAKTIEGKPPRRFELRTSELIPYPDYYQMFHNIQVLSLGAFSFLRAEQNSTATPLDKNVAAFYSRFNKAIYAAAQSTKTTIQPPAQFASPLVPRDLSMNQKKVSWFMEHSDIQEYMREIIKKYAKDIREAVQQSKHELTLAE